MLTAQQTYRRLFRVAGEPLTDAEQFRRQCLARAVARFYETGELPVWRQDQYTDERQQAAYIELEYHLNASELAEIAGDQERASRHFLLAMTVFLATGVASVACSTERIVLPGRFVEAVSRAHAAD